MKQLGSRTTQYELDKVTPEVLEAFVPPRGLNEVTLIQKEFTSLCPVTGQPDYGTVEITYEPDLACVESKSLKLYLMSYRNHGAFCEELSTQILNDLFGFLTPFNMTVSVNFASRGGVVIRSTSQRGR